MISVRELTKKFGNFVAINNISFDINDGCVYGLVGVNGAGKSTLLRLISGIYRADGGSITLDGESVYNNPSAKAKIAFVADELYLPPSKNMNSMAKAYTELFEQFDYNRFSELTALFGLNPKAPFNSFSKGMKRQAATVLALALRPKYIFFDETFDGLDPFKRGFIKDLIYEDVRARKATAIITSHSLRELEDSCDQLALLNKGGLVFESDAATLKTSKLKLQVSFSQPFDKSKFEGIKVLRYTQHGSVASMIVDGDGDSAKAQIQSMSPILMEELPLTLEEVFTYELEARGYKDSINWEEVK
ncbi:MAG: ABC transporter ATP-binding protein [Clostridia bacterium]|nr:ABC transporter ATP-binding protein [Clostridia bacterium]